MLGAMRRYSILGVQHGSHLETEIAQVDTNPGEIARGAARMVLTVTGSDGRRLTEPKWSGVRVVDNQKARS